MVEKIIKKVEIPMVKLEIEISERFYEELQAGKKQLRDKYNWELSDGEYIEKSMEDFVIMIQALKKRINNLENNGTVFEEDPESIMHG